MKYILTSSDKSLRDKFNSDGFHNNFDMNYNEVTKEYTKVLQLPTITPTVGDYLYFINNYYEQIPVKVVRLAYGSATCMIWCEKAELWQIDPFMYAAPNDFHMVYTDEFEDKIIHAVWKINNRFKELIDKAKQEYNNDEVNELNIIVNEIIRYTGVDNTCIDYTNVIYAVCDILKKNGNSYAKNWHRP